MDIKETSRQNEILNKHFTYTMHTNPRVTGYLHSRGITPFSADKWGIGYCRTYYESTPLSVLYKRITFPIHDWRGNFVSFAGRTMKKDFTGAKYIGLSDSEFFKKSHSLYGLDKALPQIVKTRVAVVVEGYTDVIGCHDFSGMTNTVGSMGVAVTVKQVELLARWAKKLIIILDGDAAGYRATERILDKLKDVDIDVSVIRLPSGKDPYDLAKSMRQDFARDVIKGVKTRTVSSALFYTK